MQLIRIFLIFLFLFSFAYSQENPKTIDKPTLVDFLFNYYQQDGDHSAVTGGVGSQELTNLEPLFIINIPMAENNLSVTAGIDMYTSASSDNIDPSVSGASGGDSRTHIDLGYTFNKPEKELSYGFSLGGSVEFDYRSLSLGANWSKGFYRGNSFIA